MAESSAYILDKDKEDAIHNWVKTALSFEGNKVIWDRPNIRRPQVPYATLGIASGPRKVGRASEERFKKLDTYRYPVRKVFTLTVGIYGGNGYLEKLESLVDSLEKPSNQTILRQAGLACWGSEDPIDLSALLDTKFEDRASVDFFLAYAKEIEDEIGQIAYINYKGLYRPFKPDENTILLYHMDDLSGPVIDSSDNGFNGINYGAKRGVEGKFKTGFFFSKDGDYDYIDLLTSQFEAKWKQGACNEGTVDLWFRPKRDINNIEGQFLFSIASIVFLSHNIYLQAYIYLGELYFDRRVNSYDQLLIVNINDLKLGTDWHLYRFTWKTDELKVFIDGNLIGTETTIGNEWDITKDLTRAKIGSDGSELLIKLGINDGWMDEFRISDIVRTEKDYFLIDKTTTLI